jgi:hypothetical protein
VVSWSRYLVFHRLSDCLSSVIRFIIWLGAEVVVIDSASTKDCSFKNLPADVA